jgi:anti-sigma regulatory factor (Ser/Thr protein kinase)
MECDDDTGAWTAAPAGFTGAAAPAGTAVRARFDAVTPALLDEVALLRRSLANWLDRLPLDVDTRQDIVLATYEALANTALHAYPGRRGRVRLTAGWTGDTVTATVTDWGRGIPAEPGHPAGQSPWGHSGLLLIDRLSDHVTLDSGDHGTRVTMRWRPPARRPADG